jgi:glycosyltransferase involved in cell wall biosynthesis
MKISVVSPSFNQAAFINETIRSVAAQDHPDKEHIIVDGMSTDGSIERIREAEFGNDHVSAIIESDRGQSDAINKGFAVATGEVLCWLNTDDHFSDAGALTAVAEFFQANPQVDICWGRGLRLTPAGETITEAWVQRPGTDFTLALQHSMGVLQPSTFFRKSVFQVVGGLRDDYPLQLDYEYWIRIAAAGFRFGFIDRVLSHAVVHEDAKSTALRMEQLNECIRLVREKFGYVPIHWIRRFGEFLLTRKDHKVTPGLSLDEAQRADYEAVERRLVTALNGDERALSIIARSDEEPKLETMEALAAAGAREVARRRRIVITSFDSSYFRQGVNLIAALHRTSLTTIDSILVYALGLSDFQRERLGALEKVQVLDYPPECVSFFPEYLDPKTRAYKPTAIRSSEPYVRNGDLVLWMDAGLAPLQNVDQIFETIARDEFFITNHDDKPGPLLNIHFAHPASHAPLGLSNADLLAEHLCSALVGYLRGGRHQGIIEQAYDLGQVRECVLWPKVPATGGKYKPVLTTAEREERDRLVSGAAPPDSVSYGRLRRLFDYYGHRTQTIYSVLSHRAGVSAHSAKVYRRSNERSSQAAVVNWAETATSTDSSSSPTAFDEVDASVAVYHHRGILDNTEGLRYKRSGEALFVVGNGPSLREFPFSRLRDKAWLGMNAAYRYWREVDLYPTYYTCFDEVVLESHEREIIAMIDDRRTLGISKFFLRESIAERHPRLRNEPAVFLLEDLQRELGSWFSRERITTGSFSVLVGWFLGYRTAYLLGIDLNYVEKLPEAVVEGKALTVAVDPKANPNYFFDGYQQKGDRYNPPNRHPGMHMRSWQQVAEVMDTFPFDVTNLSPESAVQLFPVDDFAPVLRKIEKNERLPERLAESAVQEAREQRFWRAKLLQDVNGPATPEPLQLDLAPQ